MIATLMLAWCVAPAFGKDLVVHAGTLLDAVGDAPRHRVSILIRDDRVLSVEPGFVTPPGAEVIDLADATVMPGFIDCHVHIGALLPSTTNATEYWVTHSDIDRALDDVVFAGGIASTGDDPRAQLLTNEEMRAAVETAHSLGLKVAAHIYPAAAIENAVRAGVDSVEHGSFASAQTFALMKAHGTYLVPTLSVYDVFYAAARDHPELLTPGTPAKELANDLLPKRNLPLAVKSGVKIAYGTDLGQGDHTMEFALLIANGMTPLQALYAATRNAADLLGALDQLGSIQAGRLADLVATHANPLEQPEAFGHVSFVMKGGVIYRHDDAESPPMTN